MSFTCKNNNNKSILKSPKVRLFKETHGSGNSKKNYLCATFVLSTFNHLKNFFFYTTFILKFVLINNFDTKKQLFYP